LQIIDGKARLISDLMCDGLGACLGHCPQGAITMEEREAEPYDELAVIREMVPKGMNTVIAHLSHLKEHHEFGYLKQGVRYLQEHRDELEFDLDEVIARVHSGKAQKKEPAMAEAHHHGDGGCGGGCPGSQEVSFEEKVVPDDPAPAQSTPSQLTHWPVQMHLINPGASCYQNADLLLAADCVAFAMGDFQSFLKNRALAIACPKLDSNKETYVQKLISLINEAQINTITVMKMEVPCCGGLLQLAQMAQSNAARKVPVKAVTVGIKGEVIKEEWI
jgi:ferredoxin